MVSGFFCVLLRTVDLSVDKAQAVFAMPATDIEGREIVPGDYEGGLGDYP